MCNQLFPPLASSMFNREFEKSLNYIYTKSALLGGAWYSNSGLIAEHHVLVRKQPKLPLNGQLAAVNGEILAALEALAAPTGAVL